MSKSFAKPKAKKPPTKASAGSAKGKSGPGLFAPMVRFLQNPFAGPILAGGTLSLAALSFVLIAANPLAGSPMVRASLQRNPLGPSLKMTEVTPSDSGLEAFSVDSLGPVQDVTAAGMEHVEPIQGMAVITMPDAVPSSLKTPAGRAPTVPPLAPAPISGLAQASPLGPLPQVSPDGKTPFTAYARPFKDTGQPKIALIVGGLGLNPAATRAAIDKLPADVTLSFVPYADGLQSWIDLARANGHEVMIEVPMEPTDYPENDPGPYTLMASQKFEDLNQKLLWVLSRSTGYFGVTNYLGEKFMADAKAPDTVLNILKTRGLAFIDDGVAKTRKGAYARASADRIVDSQLNPDAITRELSGLEQTAKVKGTALGMAFSYPVSVETAARWAATLPQKGLTLAPASAIAKR